MTIDRTREEAGGATDARSVSPQAGPTSLSDVLDVLSGRPERRILFHMLRADGPVKVETLAEQVAASPTPLPSSRGEPPTQEPHDHD